MNKSKTIIIILTISLLIIILFLILIHYNIIILNEGKIDNISYSSTERIKINYQRIISGPSTSDKKWYELAICERYSHASFNGAMYYNCKTTPLSDYLIDEYIEEITVRGQEYPNGHSINSEKKVSIYSIKNISSETTIALKFENTDEYYTYINSVCTPTTLRDLMEKYDFDNYISCNSVNYKKEMFDKTIFEKTVDMEISGVSNNYIESTLFNNKNIDTIDFDNTLQSPYFTITSNSEVYGSTFHFYLFKNGDLIISIPPIRKSLSCNIGTDSTNQFLNHIFENGNAHAKITSYKFLSYFLNLN